jgi:TonB family protein
MQEIVRVNYSETKGRYSTLITSLMVTMAWLSPMIGFEIFFPIALLFLYRTNHKIRAVAFQVISIILAIWVFTTPLDIACLYDSSSNYCLNPMKNWYLYIGFIVFWMFVGYGILYYESYSNSKKKHSKYYLPSSNSTIQFFPVFLAFLSAIVFFVLFNVFFYVVYFSFQSFPYLDSNQNMNWDLVLDKIFKGESALYFWFINIYSTSRFLGRKNYLAIFRKPFLSLTVHHRLMRLSTNSDSKFREKKSKYAIFRESILPGLGNIYLNRYWIGFPTLFVYLLFVFFCITAWIYYIDYSFGTSFLMSYGLKPGIPDKQFIFYASNLTIPVLVSLFLISFWLFSQYLIRTQLKKDHEPIESRGLQSGFSSNFSLSLLIHLIILSIVLIIPIMLQRNTSADKKRDMSKDHFQPEKMEFYFIDPEIPDEVKELNGGVISGTETPNNVQGEEIPDQTISEEGKVKGFVKRIKGKKLPKTYSNYISARMRGPEMFMEYWKRAPHPYSSVVAYTITTEGEITDVMIVESSSYPEQDQLTIELIESMSPVMPPPGVKGDVRVTELFWNGSIDPDAMPTPLQKEMVLMFDGRYMEEEL